MNDTWRQIRPATAILICASIMLTLSMGLRQSLGLFMQPMTRDIALTVSEFTFAIAIQNLAWGWRSRSPARWSCGPGIAR